MAYDEAVVAGDRDDRSRGAYRVRVVLASGGRAWSSPIFATVAGA